MNEVLIFVIEDFADWEVAHVSSEINKHGTGYTIKTVSIDKMPKKSMGGLTVLPDYSITDILKKEDIPAMLVIIGGTKWKEKKNKKAIKLVEKFIDEKVPIAAICDGVTFIAEYGYLDNIKHTGNTIEYLKKGALNYKGEKNFVEEQAVIDENIITANGTAYLEFGKIILETLNLLKGEKLEEWYNFWKYGFYNN